MSGLTSLDTLRSHRDHLQELETFLDAIRIVPEDLSSEDIFQMILILETMADKLGTLMNLCWALQMRYQQHLTKTQE